MIVCDCLSLPVIARACLCLPVLACDCPCACLSLPVMDAHIQNLIQEQEDAMLQIALTKEMLSIGSSDLKMTTLSMILDCPDLRSLLDCNTHADVVARAMHHVSLPRIKKGISECLGEGVCYGITDNGFANSFTFNIQMGESNRSLKIFSSGKIQCSGLKSFTECMPTAHLAAAVLNALFDRSAKDICISRLSVSLVNAVVTIDHGLDTKQLYTFLYPEHLDRVVMSQKVAHRLSWKHVFDDCKVTVFIFKSGSMIFSGAKSPKALASAYIKTMDTIDQHAAHITIERPVKVATSGKRGRKRKADTFETYLQNFLMPK